MACELGCGHQARPSPGPDRYQLSGPFFVVRICRLRCHLLSWGIAPPGTALQGSSGRRSGVPAVSGRSASGGRRGHRDVAVGALLPGPKPLQPLPSFLRPLASPHSDRRRLSWMRALAPPPSRSPQPPGEQTKNRPPTPLDGRFRSGSPGSLATSQRLAPRRPRIIAPIRGNHSVFGSWLRTYPHPCGIVERPSSWTCSHMLEARGLLLNGAILPQPGSRCQPFRN